MTQVLVPEERGDALAMTNRGHSRAIPITAFAVCDEDSSKGSPFKQKGTVAAISSDSCAIMISDFRRCALGDTDVME